MLARTMQHCSVFRHRPSIRRLSPTADQVDSAGRGGADYRADRLHLWGRGARDHAHICTHSRVLGHR